MRDDDGGVDVGRLTVDVGSPAEQLHTALKGLPHVGSATAGKLIAAKRPRLIPIFDERVEALLAPAPGLFWVSMFDALSDSSARETISNVCRSAPPHIGLLRRIDVAIWMAAA